MLALDDFVVLDPATRIEELDARPISAWTTKQARRGWLLIHDALETTAVLPAGGGLRQFVEVLFTPTRLDQVVEPDEIGTTAIAWQIVSTLVQRGFAHATREPSTDFERLRAAWREHCPHARRRLHLTTTTPQLVERIRAQPRPPAVVLACDGDRDAAVLGELTAVAIHELIVDVRQLDHELFAALRRSRAIARVACAPDAPLVQALVEAQVPVLVKAAYDTPGLAAAVTAARVTGVELAVDWDRAAFDEVVALADALGDVRIAGFPSDDELVQDTLADLRPSATEAEHAARRKYLDRRAHYLVDIEGRYVWAQDPESEDLWVPCADDLLPNHPELLELADGSIVADIAGGFGRVARRLAPHVGATGMVISVEKEPSFSSRARRFAIASNVIQFRVGLCQRIAIASNSVDAAVLEWGGEIQRTGLLGLCLAEMCRIVRPGKRVAVTYRLCNIQLENLAEVFSSAPTIYPALREAIEGANLTILFEKFWTVRSRLSGAPVAGFEEQFVPRIVDDLRGRTVPRQPPDLDVNLTVIAQKS
ncbi:MAG: methyltransferase domain-containing protein [Kofleriaceae bacterium]